MGTRGAPTNDNQEHRFPIPQLDEKTKNIWQAMRLYEWWQQQFLCRFGPGYECPSPTDHLIGSRLKIQISNPETGEWEDWTRKKH